MRFVNSLLATLLWPVYWIFLPIRLRATVLIMVDDEFLVARHLLWFNTWGLPGGGVKTSEKPSDAAIREIQEELGFAIDSSKLIELNESFDVVRSFGIAIRHKFYFVKLAKKPGVKTNKEILDYKWASSKVENIGTEVKRALELIQNGII